MSSKFALSRGNKIGIVSFGAVILLLVVALNVNNSNHLPDASETSLSSFDFGPLENPVEEIPNSENFDDKKLSFFDPNNLDAKGWVNIGFSDKQSGAIIKYRDAYGPFKSPEDVGKIYVISEDKFEEIKPFMVFDKIDNNHVDTVSYFKPIMVDVNAATKESLQEISGIGQTFSGRIVKYRDVLGGFYSKDQYAEVYGLFDESLEALEKYTLIDIGRVQKIKINSISKTELKKHPYFKKWEVVSAILSKRDKEKITSLKFLVENQIIKQSELEKMEAYVSYE